MKPILFEQPLYTFTLYTVSIKSTPSTYEPKKNELPGMSI